MSPSGICTDLSIRLKFTCTNNQVEYEALPCGLEWAKNAGVRDISAFGDSRLVVQQIKGES
jgi:ribonuclease HI